MGDNQFVKKQDCNDFALGCAIAAQEGSYYLELYNQLTERESFLYLGKKYLTEDYIFQVIKRNGLDKISVSFEGFNSEQPRTVVVKRALHELIDIFAQSHDSGTYHNFVYTLERRKAFLVQLKSLFSKVIHCLISKKSLSSETQMLVSNCKLGIVLCNSGLDKVHKLFSYYHTYEKEIADMKYNMGLDTKNIDSITSIISYHITNLNQIPSYADISGIDEAISFTLEDSDIIMTDNSTLDYFFSQIIVQIHQHCKDKNQRINKKKALWKVIYGDTKDKNNLTKKQQILFHYFIDF